MIEYTKPSVEVISFIARERLATDAETEPDAIPLANSEDDLSFGETVEPWE